MTHEKERQVFVFVILTVTNLTWRENNDGLKKNMNKQNMHIAIICRDKGAVFYTR